MGLTTEQIIEQATREQIIEWIKTYGLEEADLRTVRFNNADFNHADFKEADIKDAYLKGASVINTDLTHTIFENNYIIKDWKITKVEVNIKEIE